MAKYTEDKRIIIVHQTHPNAVLLRWLGPKNNWESWLFTGKKQEALTTDGTQSFLAPDARNLYTVRKQGRQGMTLRTGLQNRKQMEGLKHLFSSPVVHAVIDGKEQACTVSTDNIPLLDEAVKHGSLTVNITLNRINSLTQ